MDGVQAKHESIFLSSYFTSYKLVISWIGNHPCILLNAEKRNQDPSFSPNCSPAIAINLQLRLGLAKLQTLTLFTLPPICYCFRSVVKIHFSFDRVGLLFKELLLSNYILLLQRSNLTPNVQLSTCPLPTFQ